MYTFRLGEVFWLPQKAGKTKQQFSHLKISVPSRIGTFPVRFENFIKGMQSRKYRVGYLAFAIDLRTDIYIKPNDSPETFVINEHRKKNIALHATRIMQKALKLKNGFDIYIFQPYPSRVGLSTSSTIQAAIILGINKLYGEPLSIKDIIKLAVLNYGEETSTPGKLVHVPILGGVLIASLYGGGLFAVGNETTLLARTDLDDIYSIIIGIPPHLPYKGETDLDEIINNAQIRINLGRYSDKKEYVFLNKIIPALKKNKPRPVGEEIWNYMAGKYGSIKPYYKSKNPSVKMGYLIDKLLELRGNPDILTGFVSSAGPGLVYVTKKIRTCITHFKQMGISNIIWTKCINKGVEYTVY